MGQGFSRPRQETHDDRALQRATGYRDGGASLTINDDDWQRAERIATHRERMSECDARQVEAGVNMITARTRLLATQGLNSRLQQNHCCANTLIASGIILFGGGLTLATLESATHYRIIGAFLAAIGLAMFGAGCHFKHQANQNEIQPSSTRVFSA